MGTKAKKIFLTSESDEQFTVKWFGKPSRQELEETICTTANIPAGTRFKLIDADGDPLVLSASIPNNTKLKLEVLGEEDSMSKKRARPADSASSDAAEDASGTGQAGSRKKLRSAEKEGAFNSRIVKASHISKNDSRRGCFAVVRTLRDDMGFAQEKIEACTEKLHSAGKDVTVNNVLVALVEAEKALSGVAEAGDTKVVVKA
jgi:hypothetical protein